MYNSSKISIAITCAIALLFSAAALAGPKTSYGLGVTPTKEEIALWDIDVRPDGQGLPIGKGSAIEGEAMYEAKCASCHGSFGEGEGRWPPLAGGENTLKDDRPEKTVGSYWPYASTLWDYINRAMPFPAPKTLTVHEVYAITAYVLYLNDLIEDDYVLTQDNLAQVKMPNQDNFYADDRPDTHNTRCMNNCKKPKDIVIVQSLRGITPEQEEEQEQGAAKVEEKAKPTLSKNALAGEAPYKQSCFVCHGSGIADAPRTGDKNAWASRLKQGTPMLIKHAIEGYIGDAGVMPPKGGNMNLTDEQVTAAVHYMLEQN
ncbi:MAG: cytochrome C [Cycloclasticus sp. symbiont of Poecilosclerida sp. M]|nr:MAG: cytochrome C [Cycloclasticus sp. symbiont of Poecilosclerida sp. M]